jgi:uncharacterized protein (TIGR00661 family)
MKILFVVTGVGYGDATREHANILAFKAKDPKTEILVAGYDNSYKYFKDKYPTIKIEGYKISGKAMKFGVWSFILKNYLLPFFWVFRAVRLRRKVKSFDPDIIISDFEPTGLTLAKLVKKKCIMVFGYDPLLFRQYKKKNKINKIMLLQTKYLEGIYDRADFVIIPTLTGQKKRSLLYYYVDPIVRKKPEDLPSKAKIMEELKLEKEPILVMLGGSNFGLKLAKEIVEVAGTFKDEQFIMFGTQYKLKTPKNVKHIPFTRDVLKYLKASKAVITLAGQKSLSECLVYRKPMLIFPIQNHVEQLLNAFALRSAALVSHKSNKHELELRITELLAKLPILKKKINALDIKGNGSDEIVEIVYKLAKQQAKL